jgi:hypothetical protein
VPPHSGNSRAVRLSADIYRQIVSLENAYAEFSHTARPAAVPDVILLADEAASLKIPAARVYAMLSGGGLPPYAGGLFPPLPRPYCQALRVLYSRVSALYDDVLSLQRLVNLTEADRRLILTASVLQKQLTSLNKLMIDCIL